MVRGNQHNDQFLFVDVSKPRNMMQKRRIRQQAMRKTVEARMKLKNSPKSNLGQYPIWIHDSATSPCIAYRNLEAAAQCPESTESPLEKPDGEIILFPSLPLKGLEKTRATFDVDILSLSALTSFHFSQASGRIISQDCERLKNMLRFYTKASYLDYIPQLYEQSTLIRSVVDCTLAQVRHALLGRFTLPESQVLLLYGKALVELQLALQDRQRVLEPDVLCATQLLSIYEILKYSTSDRWKHHTAGAKRLIEMRGPNHYDTEFEKSLISAAVGTIYSESMAANTDCFLARPEWRDTILDLATPLNFHVDRNPAALELWSIVFPIPGLFKEVAGCIIESKRNNSAKVMELSLQCYQIRDRILLWREKYGNDSTQKLGESVAISLASQCLLQRTLVALNPLSELASKLEAETQELARKLRNLGQELLDLRYPQCNLLVAQKLALGVVIYQTKETWQSIVERPFASTELGSIHVTKAIFQEWSETLSREVS